MIAGKPDVTRISRIDPEALGRKFRMQKITFETARDAEEVHVEPAKQGDAVAVPRYPLPERRDAVLVGMFGPDSQGKHVIRDSQCAHTAASAPACGCA